MTNYFVARLPDSKINSQKKHNFEYSFLRIPYNNEKKHNPRPIWQSLFYENSILLSKTKFLSPVHMESLCLNIMI